MVIALLWLTVRSDEGPSAPEEGVDGRSSTSSSPPESTRTSTSPAREPPHTRAIVPCVPQQRPTRSSLGSPARETSPETVLADDLWASLPVQTQVPIHQWLLI